MASFRTRLLAAVATAVLLTLMISAATWGHASAHAPTPNHVANRAGSIRVDELVAHHTKTNAKRKRSRANKIRSQEQDMAPMARGWTWACDLRDLTENDIEWVPSTAHPSRYEMHIRRPGCDLRELTAAAVTSCLRGRHVAFFGDSIQRNIMLALAWFLHSGSWGSQPHRSLSWRFDWEGSCDGAAGWEAYYCGITREFGANASRAGHAPLMCDCYRRGAHDSEGVSEKIYYYAESPGIRLSQVWRTGATRLQFHRPGWLGERCYAQHQERSRPQRARRGRDAGVLPVNKEDRSSWGQFLSKHRASGSFTGKNTPGSVAACTQRGCAPGKCSQAMHLDLDGTDGIVRTVQLLGPVDAVVVNHGRWGAFSSPRELRQLLRAGAAIAGKAPRNPPGKKRKRAKRPTRGARRKGPLLVWRTTTLGRNETPGERSSPATRQRGLVKALAAAGWRVSDAGTASAWWARAHQRQSEAAGGNDGHGHPGRDSGRQASVSRLWHDPIHPAQPFYVGAAQLLVADLCSAAVDW